MNAERVRTTSPDMVLPCSSAQEAGSIRENLPPGLALVIVIKGGIVQFWLQSQLEVRDSLAVTHHQALSDEAFLDLVVSLVAR